MSVLLAAGAGLALMDWLSSKGQTLTITDNITTNMSITATTNVATECFESLSASQTINVTSGPNTNTELLSQACTNCTNYINSIITARKNLEQAAQLANPAYQPQQANPVLESEMITGGSAPITSVSQAALGPCTAMCSDIVLLNVSQSARLSAKQDCQVTTDITTDISQSIKGQISAYLKNQQDIIGQLESAFTSNQEKIETDLASTMSQSLTNNFIQDLNQAMQAVQSFELKGNSILATDISQSFSGAMVGQLQVNNTVVDQLRQSANYSISQSLLNKNDTIGDLSQDFLQVIQTMSALLEELTSQILLIIGAIIIAVVLVIGTLFVFNQSFHNWTNQALGRVANKALVGGYSKPAKK